jgi:hypothetical protein
MELVFLVWLVRGMRMRERSGRKGRMWVVVGFGCFPL